MKAAERDDESTPATTFAIVLTTVGSEGEADRIAGALVERRLAACVNVVPGVMSHYRWEGALRRDNELLLLVKTSVEKFPAVRKAILELHSYEVPEVVMLPIGDGSASYLQWLAESLRQD